jgi:hypothetical protein
MFSRALRKWPPSPRFRSTSASILTFAGGAIFLLRAASAIASAKEADQPAANSCSGLVPMRAEPIVLKDGRVIVTLNDARVIMRSLPAASQGSDVWLYAGGLMLEAATSNVPIGEAAAQLRPALRADGLL